MNVADVIVGPHHSNHNQCMTVVAENEYKSIILMFFCHLSRMFLNYLSDSYQRRPPLGKYSTYANNNQLKNNIQGYLFPNGCVKKECFEFQFQIDFCGNFLALLCITLFKNAKFSELH